MVALFAVILLFTLLSVVAYADVVNRKSVRGIRAWMVICTTALTQRFGDFVSLSLVVAFCLLAAFISIEHEHPEIVPLISIFLFFQLRLMVVIGREIKRLRGHST